MRTVTSVKILAHEKTSVDPYSRLLIHNGVDGWMVEIEQSIEAGGPNNGKVYTNETINYTAPTFFDAMRFVSSVYEGDIQYR